MGEKRSKKGANVMDISIELNFFLQLMEYISLILKDFFSVIVLVFWTFLGAGIYICKRSGSFRSLIVLFSLAQTLLLAGAVIVGELKFGLTERLGVTTALRMPMFLVFLQHVYIGESVFKLKGARLPTLLFSVPALLFTWLGAFVMTAVITNQWLYQWL
jgi:hypothetical protein